MRYQQHTPLRPYWNRANHKRYTCGLWFISGSAKWQRCPILVPKLKCAAFPRIQDTASSIRNVLAGSYLWQHQDGRPLQDPLSFRTTVFVLNEARREWNEAYQMLEIQMNSSDDNPAVIVNADRSLAENSQLNSTSLAKKRPMVKPLAARFSQPLILNLCLWRWRFRICL